jgi:germination protein M
MKPKHLIVILGVVLVALLGFAAASCGTGEGAEAVGSVPSADVPTTAPAATKEEAATTTAPDSGRDEAPKKSEGGGSLRYQVWFADAEGATLYVAWRTHEATPRVGAAALEDLLAGPTEAERAAGVFTAIPADTRLLGLRIDHGTAFVDLTSEFESGGGSLSMRLRLAQVACTLDQFPSVEGVAFMLDGELVDVFSGEGIVLDHAVQCSLDYEELLPAIVVEQPRPGQGAPNPLTISGTANVFEANVTVVVLNAAGREIARTFTTATCGSGCRGRFSVDLPYDVAKEQAGTVVVHDDDAAGVGSPPHEVRIPVILTPSA